MQYNLRSPILRSIVNLRYIKVARQVTMGAPLSLHNWHGFAKKSTKFDDIRFLIISFNHTNGMKWYKDWVSHGITHFQTLNDPNDPPISIHFNHSVPQEQRGDLSHRSCASDLERQVDLQRDGDVTEVMAIVYEGSHPR